MFRTSILRTAQLAAGRNSMRYSTAAAGKPAPSTGGGSNNLLWIAGLAGLVGAGAYYYSTRTPPPVAADAKAKPAAAQVDKSLVALNPDHFQPFKLSDVKDVSHNTRMLRFELEPEQTFGLHVASCVVARLPKKGGKEDEFVIRPYTPVSHEEDKGHVEFVIKHYNDGQMTPGIFDLKKGDTLEFKGPIPKFKYETNKYNNIGFIAGGTGITPLLQVVRRIFSDPADKTTVSLLFANVTEGDILLREDLEALAAQYPGRFKLHYTLDKPDKKWAHYTGFVNENMVKETMPTPGDGNIVMVCGPPPMLASVAGAKGPKFTQGEVGGVLKALGYNENQVFKF